MFVLIQKNGKYPVQNATAPTQVNDIHDVKNMRSQIVTESQKKRNIFITPYAFTEHGVTMIASILKSERAIEDEHCSCKGVY